MARIVTTARMIATLLAITGATPSLAALTFQMRTGLANNSQAMIVDSNKCPNEGPTSAFVGGMITNAGATTATNISAILTGLNANVYLTGGDVATRAIGSLNPAESIGIYWFVGYSCNQGAITSPTITMTSSAGTQTANLSLRVREALSANAGGNVETAVLGPGAVVGQTIYYDATYSFGGAATGDEYYLQPAGGQNFNAGCFRLVGNQINGSTLNSFSAGQTNRMYSTQGASQSGSGYAISVRYAFQYLCAATSTVARPYGVQTSGSSNIKYTGNFDGTGSIAISYPGATNPFTITKTVNPPNGIAGSTGVLTYTVTVSNPSPYASIIDRIVDVLPSGMSFNSIDAASTVTAANSSSIPAANATGTLNFLGKLGSSYPISAGGNVTLVYKANRPTNVGDYINVAQGVIGRATTPAASATYRHGTIQALKVTKVSSTFSDPVRGTNNPLAFTDSLIEFAIGVTNPNAMAMDPDSVEILDTTPTLLRMCAIDFGGTGSGPVIFTDGAPSSNLTFTYGGLASLTDSIDFSNDGGTNWTYVPQPASDGCDAAITTFRAKPTGGLSSSGNFTLRVRYRIN